ncbi:MAG: DUF1214 domain-containing protein [Proteobacteria bacterium]|nr:DUF1214 domain-containing protein [Pseudomonadota bacterium]
MKLALKILAVLVIGILLGLGATWLFVVRGAMPGGVTDGPWKTNLLIGSSGGDMRVRAAVAVHGLFALNRSETIYYSTNADSDGNRLDGNCTYLLTGRDPPARWWSITAYAADDYLIPNAAKRYSVSKNSVTRNAAGQFTATLSRRRSSRDWIALGGKRFSLTLRLYNPSPSVAADPAHVALPSIKKVSCS